MARLLNGLVNKALALGAIQIPEELGGLYDIVSQLAPSNVLEIGSEAGGTFYLWCRMAAQSGIKISLDLPTGSSGSGKFKEQAALAARSAEFRCWAANVHIVTGDSHCQKSHREVADILAGTQLDFLFIDGDHSYEGVKLDFEDYRGFVRSGGLIAFHDINDSEYHRKHGCYVSQFWAELIGVKSEINQHLDWGGIGILHV